MRRFILGWRALGHARRYSAEIVNSGDDFCIVGCAPSAEVLAAAQRLMVKLKLAINPHKTRGLRCPEESFMFPGYRMGRNYRPNGSGPAIGTRPGKASVQGFSAVGSVSRRIGVKWGRMLKRWWSG